MSEVTLTTPKRKASKMPNVGGKKYPYTAAGMKAAAKARKKAKAKPKAKSRRVR